MERMLIFLLFVTAFTGKISAEIDPVQEYDETQKVGFVTLDDADDIAGEPAYRRRLESEMECTLDSDDEDGFCELMADTHRKEAQMKKARTALGDCEYESPRIVMLVRDDQSWVYITETPEKSFNDMVDFLRDQHTTISDTHDLIISYSYTTRDTKKRTLRVQNDMDLWSAFQLQEKYAVTELRVFVDTIAPSGQPTTGHPSVSPTKSQSPSIAPTSSIATEIATEEAIVWMAAELLKRKKLKFGSLLYRMSDDGKAASYFHKKVDGKGKHMCIVKRSKVSNYQLFGSFSDISWASSGGYKYCNGCYLWIWDDGKYQKYVSTIRRYAQYGAYLTSSYGPCHGGGHDYCINSPSTPYGYTSQGHTWWAPNKGYPYYYGGTSRFDIEDWECFSTISVSG